MSWYVFVEDEGFIASLVISPLRIFSWTEALYSGFSFLPHSELVIDVNLEWNRKSCSSFAYPGCLSTPLSIVIDSFLEV